MYVLLSPENPAKTFELHNISQRDFAVYHADRPSSPFVNARLTKNIPFADVFDMSRRIELGKCRGFIYSGF